MRSSRIICITIRCNAGKISHGVVDEFVEGRVDAFAARRRGWRVTSQVYVLLRDRLAITIDPLLTLCTSSYTDGLIN